MYFEKLVFLRNDVKQEDLRIEKKEKDGTLMFGGIIPSSYIYCKVNVDEFGHNQVAECAMKVVLDKDNDVVARSFYIQISDSCVTPENCDVAQKWLDNVCQYFSERQIAKNLLKAQNSFLGSATVSELFTDSAHRVGLMYSSCGDRGQVTCIHRHEV